MSWLKTFSKKATNPTRKASFTPTLEGLEDRQLLSVSATFTGYGGKLLPSFPSWLIHGTKPNHIAWLLKERLLPLIYWNAMLRGREWMAKPKPGGG